MNYWRTFLQVLSLEADAIRNLSRLVTEEQVNQLVEIYREMVAEEGQIIFCGVGKSGYIAQKLSSTFSSLGCPSFFLHPTEALHGDLGRVSRKDVMVLLSRSGTTEELLKLTPFLPFKKDRLIGLLGNPLSALGETCGLVLPCPVDKEACLNDQAPTTSTTAMMAMGDAMAVVYQQLMGLTREHFLRQHPGGLLGKSLRLQVKDLMIPPQRCAVVYGDSTLGEMIVRMTEHPQGIGAVIHPTQGHLLGILVEGDMRRLFMKGELKAERSVQEVINPNPLVIAPESLALEALKVMELRDRPISVLPVVERDSGRFVGVIRLHDLLREGLIVSSSASSSFEKERNA